MGKGAMTAQRREENKSDATAEKKVPLKWFARWAVFRRLHLHRPCPITDFCREVVMRQSIARVSWRPEARPHDPIRWAFDYSLDLSKHCDGHTVLGNFMVDVVEFDGCAVRYWNHLCPQFTMSRSLSRKIYSDVFARWPKQALRPDHQLQDVLGKAVTERYQNYKPSMEREELLKARALQFLLQDRYNDRFKLKGRLLEPKSQPTYFEDLVREIDEAPNRSWLERLGKRLSGMIRFQ